MRLSILVVSRTARLLNRFLDSLNQACNLDPLQTEILCSWNGTFEEERCITNTSCYDFHIAQHVPYHFSGNINGLIQKSNADLLMIANDDLILDPNCVNAGVETLESRSEIGLVGAVLRTASGVLTHAGINFDARGSAYHILDQLVPADQPSLAATGPVAAVTGALQWIRRSDALAQPLNELYCVCGEDVELCLDVQQHLNKQVWLCAEAHAIHEAESTRAQQPEQAGNSEDLLRLRSRYHNYLAHATADQWRLLLLRQQAESMQLRDLIEKRNWELDERCALLEMKLQRLRHDAIAIEDLQEERLRLRAMLELSSMGNIHPGVRQ
jgi:GT2 family glycosyltransferase